MWKAFAEHLKECGRHGGGLFLIGLLGAPACAAVVSSLGESAALVLWSIWAVLFAKGLARFIHQWRNPARLGRLPPLSRHDLRVARSKLTKHRNQQPG
jgi:membrane protein implicated in regulation of membrane protease activity